MKKTLRSAMIAVVVSTAILAGLSPRASAQNAAPEAHARIVGGTEAGLGKWPSMVAIFARVQGYPKPQKLCGGAVIGQQWVLTAAHCKIAKWEGSPILSFFIREGTQDLNSAQKHDVDVAEFIINEKYDPISHINDVAVMKLKGPANSPRQKLVSRNIRDSVVAEKQMATVIGFGSTDFATDPLGSDKLLEVDLPIVGEQACKQVWHSSITDGNFCAGGGKGKDSCNGDSGGPLFVTTKAGEKLQAGVVSFGPEGCGVENVYGVYTSVGTFEKWIKDRVSDAEFALPPSQPGEAASGLVDGTAAAQNPSDVAQVKIDIVEGNRVRVKSYIKVRVSSSASGSLVIFNENPDGTGYQLYPSKDFPGPDGRKDAAHIQAGVELQVPSDTQLAQNYRIQIDPPLGLNHLRALVVPAGGKIGEIIAENSDGETIRDLATVIQRLVDETQRGAHGVHLTDRGSADVSYEIVN